MAGDHLHEQESGGYQLMRDDAWAWEEIERALKYFRMFLVDIRLGIFTWAKDDHVVAIMESPREWKPVDR